MAFRPAGAEDSGSDEDGLILSDDGGGLTKDSRKSFYVMPAGAESDDDDEDLDFGSGNLVSSQIEIRSAQKIDKQSGRTNVSGGGGVKNVGKGRGVFQPKGRGRGGFPLQPPSFSNKRKTPERFDKLSFSAEGSTSLIGWKMVIGLQLASHACCIIATFNSDISFGHKCM